MKFLFGAILAVCFSGCVCYVYSTPKCPYLNGCCNGKCCPDCHCGEKDCKPDGAKVAPKPCG